MFCESGLQYAQKMCEHGLQMRAITSEGDLNGKVCVRVC